MVCNDDDCSLGLQKRNKGSQTCYLLCVDVERGNGLSGGAVRCQLYQSLNAFICIVSAYRNIGGGSLGVFFPQNKDFKQALMPVMLDPI